MVRNKGYIFVHCLIDNQKMHMKTLFCLLFFLGMIPLAAIAENEEIERLLLKLDSLIAQIEIIEKEKEFKI